MVQTNYVYSNDDQGRVYQNCNFHDPGAGVLVLNLGQISCIVAGVLVLNLGQISFIVEGVLEIGRGYI